MAGLKIDKSTTSDAERLDVEDERSPYTRASPRVCALPSRRGKMHEPDLQATCAIVSIAV